MAPTLRSSAPNTPTGKLSATNTPRKTPQCAKCKRPRAGHPRTGCPYVDSPSKARKAEPPLNAHSLPDALGSMRIASPARDRDEDTKATIRNRRRSFTQPRSIGSAESLVSLSATSSEIVDRLLRPGMFDGDDRAGTAISKTKMVRWQDMLPETLAERKPRVKMPGSLCTPSPESSIGSIPAATNNIEALPYTLGDAGDARPAEPKRLARSMSLEQRETFVAALTSASEAAVYVLPSADLPSIHASATELGFHSRSVTSMGDHSSQGLLVLGRDEKAVQTLFNNVRTEYTEPSARRGRWGTDFAEGLVAGAVGAWAGLAFA